MLRPYSGSAFKITPGSWHSLEDPKGCWTSNLDLLHARRALEGEYFKPMDRFILFGSGIGWMVGGQWDHGGGTLTVW